MPPITTVDPEAVEPEPTDPTRRTVLRAGLVALPVWAAGCGGGEAGALASEAPVRAGVSSASTGQVRSAASQRFPTRIRPSVGMLGAASITAPSAGAAAPNPAYWIVFDAGTDARALEVLSGTSHEVDRLELAVDNTRSVLLKLQADRSIRSIHAARAGQVGYQITMAASLSGALVARWDFELVDQIQCVELMAHPAVGAADGLELECVGWAL